MNLSTYKFPGRPCHGHGHVYLIQFDNGVVKAGLTAGAPRSRISGVATDAAAREGASVARIWLSPEHLGYRANEKSLIKFLSAGATSHRGSEYFVDVDFDLAEEFAAGLPFFTNESLIPKAPPAATAGSLTFVLSLDEIARVAGHTGLPLARDLADRTGITRKTWSTALRTRRATPDILDALADLGARADRVLVLDDATAAAVAS